MTTIEPIELTVLTSTERAAVWIVLTDPTRLAEWFAQATEAGPAGAPYRLDFGAGSVVVGTIREHDPGRTFDQGRALRSANHQRRVRQVHSVLRMGRLCDCQQGSKQENRDR